MIIIGVTGTLGAGKGEIVNYFKTKGFIHYSARNFIIDEIKRRGGEINRDVTTMVANDLREKNSPSYIIECLYDQAKAANTNAVIESVRTIGEMEFLKKQENFVLFAIDADPKIRYERIQGRKTSLDNVTFQKFLLDEKTEMHSDDPHKGNIAGCMEKADYLIMNNGTIEDLHRQLDEILPEILNN